MTKKDYVVLAKALKEAAALAQSDHKGYSPSQYGGVRIAVDTIMEALGEDNRRFNSDRFLDAIYTVGE